MNMVILMVLTSFIPEDPGTFVFLAWNAFFEITSDGWYTWGTSISNYPLMFLLTGLTSLFVYGIIVLILKLKKSGLNKIPNE